MIKSYLRFLSRNKANTFINIAGLESGERVVTSGYEAFKDNKE